MTIALSLYAARLGGIERFKQRESDIDRLIILFLSRGHIARQSSDGTTRRRSQKFFASEATRGIVACQPAHGDRFNVTFDAGDLSGKEDSWMLAHLHGWLKHPRRV